MKINNTLNPWKILEIPKAFFFVLFLVYSDLQYVAKGIKTGYNFLVHIWFSLVFMNIFSCRRISRRK